MNFVYVFNTASDIVELPVMRRKERAEGLHRQLYYTIQTQILHQMPRIKDMK